MKLIIEDCDIQEVQEMISDYYQISLTQEQTRTFIENELSIAAEAFQYGWSETETRRLLWEAFYERLCKESLPDDEVEAKEKIQIKAKEFGFKVNK